MPDGDGSDPLDPEGETGDIGDDGLAELAAETDEQSEESQAAETAKNVADGIRGAIGGVLSSAGNATGAFFGQLLSPVPFSGKIWKGMAKRGIYNYHRTSGGDRLGLEVKPNGQMELTPVLWKSAQQCEDDERPGWHAKGREDSWRATTLGQTGPRLGKTPVIPLDTESWKSTSILEAQVAEAVDQGDTRPLYRVDEAELTAEIDMGAGGQRARADGGYAVDGLQFNPRSSPIFDDMIIDLGSEDYSGQAVSWTKTSELLRESTTQEEMNMQEKRGEIMGRSRDDMMAFAKRIFLYAALVALGGLIGPELVSALVGGGGGGGGSIVPIMAGAL